MKDEVPHATFGTAGLDGDASAVRGADDTEQAVCVYPADHFPWWSRRYHDGHRFVSGAFGENLTVSGLTEHSVCVGDVWRVGSVGVQVTKPRYPCRKLDVVHGIPGLAQVVRESLRTGWYMSVVSEGRAGSGYCWTLEERPNPSLSVARVAEVRFSGERDRATMSELVRCEGLAEDWRAVFEARLKSRVAS